MKSELKKEKKERHKPTLVKWRLFFLSWQQMAASVWVVTLPPRLGLMYDKTDSFTFTPFLRNTFNRDSICSHIPSISRHVPGKMKPSGIQKRIESVSLLTE